MSVYDARQATKEFISSCNKYFQRDGVGDFINDTLVFEVRLNSDPDIFVKWSTVADDMRMLVKNDMSLSDFVDRCKKTEVWPADL